MASILPFDNGTIGGDAFATTDMVHGSGSAVFEGTDIQVTTADGRIHNVRQSVKVTASFELYGDQTAFKTGVGVAEAMVLKRDSATIQGGSFNGLCSAVYDKSTETTRIDITSDSTWT